MVAGAMSMAAGEYVSVYSQADTEKADLARERRELATEPEAEREELTQIYEKRGLDRQLAQKVAEQLMAGDALAAHARDELGLTEAQAARPLQAAVASAGSFAIGAALPLVVAAISPTASMTYLVGGTSLFFLAVLGAVAANAGGAPMMKGSFRVAFWGALAMVITSLVGSLFGAVA